MKTRSKIGIFLFVVAVLAAGGVYARRVYSRRGVVEVRTGRVVRQDLTSLVTASGEIKPKNYVNIGANAMGQLTEILVHEGERVRKGQLLARIENVQPEAEVEAQRAALSSAEADSGASEAGLRAADDNLETLRAVIERNRADLERMKTEFGRSELLFKEQLIARQEFEAKKAAYDAQTASLKESEARLVQARAQREQTAAQLASTQRRITQARANLVRVTDVLNKHNSYAPLDGVVTNLPVRVGETVVPGVQNSAASTIMTIADMSVITAEVKVDEADIVRVQLGQQAEITIEAIPNRVFKGQVLEIGNTAILRSTGLAASQSAISSQEAKDFKIVIALDDPPAEIRPGLTCTARITTATRQDVLTIPVQALTVRQRADLEPESHGSARAKKEEIQGVFVVIDGKAEFREVKTGITGSTDTEVVSGLKQEEEIVTGTYQVIRTLRHQARVKVANEKTG